MVVLSSLSPVAGRCGSVSTVRVPGDPILTVVNADPPAAERDLRSCCASRRWAAELAGRRPFTDPEQVLAASAAILADLDWADVREALDAHPRIGDRASGGSTEAAWSRAEQSAAATADERVQADLVAGNRAYEDRFGHVFLICATGLSAETVLAALRARLGADEDTERATVRAELTEIVALRLRKLAAG